MSLSTVENLHFSICRGRSLGEWHEHEKVGNDCGLGAKSEHRL